MSRLVSAVGVNGAEVQRRLIQPGAQKDETAGQRGDCLRFRSARP